jgi:hypothetical protein
MTFHLPRVEGETCRARGPDRALLQSVEFQLLDCNFFVL